jgi:protein JSN1
MVDRMWEIAQGRFGARSMRACLESTHIPLSQQRRITTAVILNSIPLATNPNGALLLTWLLDTSSFPSRYNLFALRFTPHLPHLCTHKLASLTVLRIVNQKIEFEASRQIVQALFSSPGDHVLTDVLGDQVNGVAVVHKILTNPFIDPIDKPTYIEATKRVLIELKVIATQAYRRLIEEIGLPIPNYQPTYTTNGPPGQKGQNQNHYGVPGLSSGGYPSNDQGLASMMASDMAKVTCQHFMDARLIKNAAGLGSNLFKDRGTYVLTPEGLNVLERFISKNGMNFDHRQPVFASQPICITTSCTQLSIDIAQSPELTPSNSSNVS